ncbi:MAG TPA: hypothetical protein PL181_13850 [bacterium]|nr:hypothetical protein [bacterium]
MSADFAAIDIDLLLAGAAPAVRPGPRLLAVGSGHRGSGITTISWLLALILAESGRRTVLLDSDLAAAGFYGRATLSASDQRMRQFLQERGADINLLPQPAGPRNLSYITGSPAICDHPQLSLAAKQKLLLHLRQLQADELIIDCGQGASYRHLDLFLAADIPIVLARIPNSSLLECYQFIRYGYLRKIQHKARHWPEHFARISGLGDLAHPETLATLPAFAATLHDAQPHLRAVIEEGWGAFQPRLIINRVRPDLERRRVRALAEVVKVIMGITLTEWGEVPEDERLGKVQASGKFEEMRRSRAAVELVRILREQASPAASKKPS